MYTYVPVSLKRIILIIYKKFNMWEVMQLYNNTVFQSTLLDF